jgi:hypothetical protein
MIGPIRSSASNRAAITYFSPQGKEMHDGYGCHESRYPEPEGIEPKGQEEGRILKHGMIDPYGKLEIFKLGLSK